VWFEVHQKQIGISCPKPLTLPNFCTVVRSSISQQHVVKVEKKLRKLLGMLKILPIIHQQEDGGEDSSGS
jgi:hypothetical protein